MDLNLITTQKEISAEIKTAKPGLKSSSMSRKRGKPDGEREIKALLNSGFIIKSDEDFLCNVYGRIDKDIRSSYNGIFNNGNFIEVQGASFQQMTVYGRNSTIKNLIMSRDKLAEINLKNHSNNFSFNPELNNDFRLSGITLKNYFSLKETNLPVNAEKSAPGNIFMELNGETKNIGYTNKEMPSLYKFDYENKKDLFNAKPESSILKDYYGTMDGFRNSKVTINGQKIIEMESTHNWQKIKDYIKERDFSGAMGKTGVLDRIEVHHINQLQDGGKENIYNLVSLSKKTHNLVDSYRLLIDKNTSFLREMRFSFNPGEGNAENLVNEIGKLNLKDKIFLNSLKLEVEANSALRLNIFIDRPETLKMHFVDKKTGEEFRLVASKIDNETDRIIAKTALINFISELPTSTL